MRRARRRLVLLVAGAAIAVAGLLGPAARATTGPRATAGWTGLEAWYQAVGAATATMALLRLVALALAGWLALASALQLVATRSRRSSVAWFADRVSPPALRRLVPHAAGLSLAVVLAGPPTPTDPAGTAVMEVLEVDTAPADRAPPPRPPPAPPAPAPVSPPPPDDEVVVAPGDSFWRLAVEAVAGHGPPVAVDDYWRRLIDANRTRLVDPSNPDLLYPGQVLRLPPRVP